MLKVSLIQPSEVLGLRSPDSVSLVPAFAFAGASNGTFRAWD
jgi:hypothetical protein